MPGQAYQLWRNLTQFVYGKEGLIHKNDKFLHFFYLSFKELLLLYCMAQKLGTYKICVIF